MMKFINKMGFCQKSRTTVLLGAGSVIDIGAPTTDEITQDIINADLIEVISNKEITLLKEVYNILKKNYRGATNFETIFHVLEMLNAYSGGWNGAKNAKMTPPFAFFVKLVKELPIYEYQILNQSIQKSISVIVEKVAIYNNVENLSRNEWYKKLWQRNDSKWDFFTLNYDTTIEKIIKNYEDGFQEIKGYNFMCFNPNKLLKNQEKKSTISHLHGSVEFGYSMYDSPDVNIDVYDYAFADLYKWPSYQDAKETWFSRSNASTQAGEQLYQGPIIAGLHKLEKLNCYPYSLYHSFFVSKVASNRQLLVVGYSFGDLYINQLIERMNIIHGTQKRVIVISYLGYNSKDELYWYVYSKRTSSEVLFLEKMMKEESWYKRYTEDDNDKHNPIISRDGSMMFFMHGFKDAMEKHSKLIFNYLSI